jgi:DnaK suppressor protein
VKKQLQNESLRQLLIGQKAQLIDKMNDERGGYKSRAEAAWSQLSAAEQTHAQNITERDTAFAMQEHDVAELEAIELALNRIANGKYGQCEICDHEIPITRLLAYPPALRCLTCQSAIEQHERQGLSSSFH